MKVPAFPILNWVELERLVTALGPLLRDLYVERIVVPERPRLPGGYHKGEWSIRLQGRKQEVALLLSVRPRRPYLALENGRGGRAAAEATHSPFSLALSKSIRGLKVEDFRALPRERVAVLWFATAHGAPRLGLVISLIPAVPEALLVQEAAGGGQSAEWTILLRSRVTAGEAVYRPPTGGTAPAAPVVHEEWIESPERWRAVLDRALDEEAFAARITLAQRALRERLQHAEERVRQSETARDQSREEPDWGRYGELLKPMLAAPPELGSGNTRRLQDFATGEWVEVPCDPKLGVLQQVEKFFQNARRKARRLTEAEKRIAEGSELTERLRAQLGEAPVYPDWAALEKLEALAGLSPVGAPVEAPRKTRGGPWLGKTFRSRDGLAILVGRSRDENLELTFKVARGNDMWLHVRGRPGAHVVIPLNPGKSAPLETLLDAAMLAIHYSGGGSWGKTEVDYTFKKHVKRIRDSTEASYTHNKTLLVTPDRERLKRLLEAP